MRVYVIATAAALALSLSLSAVAAHTTADPRAVQRVEDNVVATIVFDSDIVEVGVPAAFDVYAFHYGGGDHVQSALTVEAPAAADVAPLSENATGHHRGSVTFRAAGPAELLVTVAPDGPTVRLPVEVYPASPYRVWWHDASDRHVEQDAAATFVFSLTRDGAPVAAGDGVARFTHWANDQATAHFSRDVPLAAHADGGLAATTAFPDGGLYTIDVGVDSLGLAPGDRPPLRFFVHAAADDALASHAAPPLEARAGADDHAAGQTDAAEREHAATTAHGAADETAAPAGFDARPLVALGLVAAVVVYGFRRP